MSIPRVVRKCCVVFIPGIILAILGFIGLNAAMEPTSKSQFCGSQCHEMKPAYRSWELSPHGANKYGIRVDCVECHLPPKEDYFSYVVIKGHDGTKDILKHFFGDEYNFEKAFKQAQAKMPNKRCMHCHDNLLVKPGNSGALKAHKASLANPDKPENKCVGCHEGIGHERQSKLFSP